MRYVNITKKSIRLRGKRGRRASNIQEVAMSTEQRVESEDPDFPSLLVAFNLLLLIQDVHLRCKQLTQLTRAHPKHLYTAQVQALTGQVPA